MPENDGKIYITISDTRPKNQQGGDVDLAQPQKKQEAQEKDKKTFSNVAKIGATVGAMAIQAANYALNNIGNFTGAYQSQREVNAAKSAIMKVAGGVTSFYVGGWVGLAAYTAITAFDFGLSEYSNQIEFKKQNYAINRLREVSGLDGLTNGGRI